MQDSNFSMLDRYQTALARCLLLFLHERYNIECRLYGKSKRPTLHQLLPRYNWPAPVDRGGSFLFFCSNGWTSLSTRPDLRYLQIV